MKLKLKRTAYLVTGIFGELYNEKYDCIAFTLEHAYLLADKSIHPTEQYAPKLPDGTYTCKRGMHRLHGMDHDFEAFEVLNVPGHTGILFHVGNYNRDSDGCILLGEANFDNRYVTHSKAMFEEFMYILRGEYEFTLEVE